jgi:hypothetical protein
LIKRNEFKTTEPKVAKRNDDSAMRYFIRKNSFSSFTIPIFLRLCLPLKVKSCTNDAGNRKNKENSFLFQFSLLSQNWRGVIFKTTLISHSYELLTKRIIAEKFGNK